MDLDRRHIGLFQIGQHLITFLVVSAMDNQLIGTRIRANLKPQISNGSAKPLDLFFEIFVLVDIGQVSHRRKLGEIEEFDPVFNLEPLGIFKVHRRKRISDIRILFYPTDIPKYCFGFKIGRCFVKKIPTAAQQNRQQKNAENLIFQYRFYGYRSKQKVAHPTNLNFG